MQKIYNLRVQQDGFVVSLPILLEDAKHSTNLFTMEAKHPNLLGQLGPILLVALAERDGLPSHVCRSCKRRAFTVEKKLHWCQLFILEHHFRFPYLTEGVRYGLSKCSFPGTDRHRSELECNDLHVSIMYSHETRTRFLIPHKKWGVCRCANSRYRGLGMRLSMM